MIDLHYWPTPNGKKVTILLEELGVPYRIVDANIGRGDQFTDDFLRISPNNRMPAMVDTDPEDGGEPVAIFESGAIMLYLAERAGALIPADEKGRSLVVQWLMFQIGGLGPMMGQANVFFRYFPEKIQPAIDRYQNESRRLLEVLDGRLRQSEWLGDDYSIADIATWPWARLVGALLGPDAAKDYPKLTEWVARIAERPAAQRAVKHTDEVRAKTTAFDKAQPDTMDKVFGRGAYKAA